MNGRDWAMLGSGALVAAASVAVIYETRAALAGAVPSSRHAAQLAQPVSRAEPEQAELALQASPPVTATGGGEQAGANREVTELKRKLVDVQRQKRDLEAELQTVEKELAQRLERKPADDRYEFELDRDDWKELAASGRIKYRVPCTLPEHPTYQLPATDLDDLGLSPDDGKALLEAHRRSNARVWSVLRPLCVQVVGNAEIVDMLRAQTCLDLIERKSAREDLYSYQEARRLVAEVHAGIKPAPTANQPRHPLYLAQMALTSEAELFRADLAESFGPEEAKRIARSLRCTATVR